MYHLTIWINPLNKPCVIRVILTCTGDHLLEYNVTPEDLDDKYTSTTAGPLKTFCTLGVLKNGRGGEGGADLM